MTPSDHVLGTFAHFTEHESPTWSPKKLLERFSLIDDETERHMAEEFIHRCLRLTPEDRATVAQLIKDPWLEGVQL